MRVRRWHLLTFGRATFGSDCLGGGREGGREGEERLHACEV